MKFYYKKLEKRENLKFKVKKLKEIQLRWKKLMQVSKN